MKDDVIVKVIFEWEFNKGSEYLRNCLLGRENSRGNGFEVIICLARIVWVE